MMETNAQRTTVTVREDANMTPSTVMTLMLALVMDAILVWDVSMLISSAMTIILALMTSVINKEVATSCLFPDATHATNRIAMTTMFALSVCTFLFSKS